MGFCAGLVRLAAGAALAATASVAPRAGEACGRDSDCALGDRSFRIALPEGGKPRGAVIFAHGHRGSADRVMSNPALAALTDRLGVAFVAAQGEGGTWNTPNNPGAGRRQGDELAYFDALSDTLRDQYAIPPERTIVSGFSSGAMLVWTLACERGDAYAGFAPLSGTFWVPVPEHCPTVPNGLMHFHGTEDEVVPMAGRAIGDARQADVRDAFALMRSLSDYGPATQTMQGNLACTRQVDSEDRLFAVCTFPGGHGYRLGFIEMAIEAFLPAE
jgi:polyhydroxybutyrate depolymerase